MIGVKSDDQNSLIFAQQGSRPGPPQFDPGGRYSIYSDAYHRLQGTVAHAIRGLPGSTLGTVVTASNAVEDVTLNRSSSLRIDQSGYAEADDRLVGDSGRDHTMDGTATLAQSDDRSTTAFRECWHFQIPRLIR